MSLTLKKLDSSNIADFEKIFSGEKSSGCYCASWRAMDETWEARCKDPRKPNLDITKKHVENGMHIGFIVYEDSSLIGWAGAGPKTDFPTMERERFGARLSPFLSETWVIGCLAVESDLGQRDGFAEIVTAVIEKAAMAGAIAVEAYPTRPWDKARAYRGSQQLYERLGFKIVGIENDGSSEILLMRLDLNK